MQENSRSRFCFRAFKGIQTKLSFLFRNIPVGAVDDAGIHVAVPFGAQRNRAPLGLGAGIVDIFEEGTIGKGALADARHALGKIDACKADAVGKRPIGNGLYPLRDRDLRERRAIGEGSHADFGNAGRNFNGG